MKRHLTPTEKKALLDKFSEHLDKVSDCKIDFHEEIKSPEKVKIFYTPEAFSKTVRLIMSHSTEIAWHCLVRKKGADYEVYDVLSYPQTVGPAHVHVKMGRSFGDGKPKDPTKYYIDWYNEVVLEMPEEEEANLCGQCHSHVNMGTTPSSVDLTQQKEELELKGGKGYYLFQIWNKKLEVNTFLYDLDAGILYEKNDVDVIVEDDEFTSMSHEMLTVPEEKPKEEPKKEEKKSYPAETYDWEKYYRRYEMMSEYDDAYSDYLDDIRRPLQKFAVTIADRKDVENCTEFVIEAHDRKEAYDLFNTWIFSNEDRLDEELGLTYNENDPDLSILVMDVVQVGKGEPVDVSYAELAGEYN